MIKAIGILLLGAVIGGAAAWFVMEADGGGSSPSPVNVSAPAEEVVANLNARLADAEATDAAFVETTYRDWGAADVDAALAALAQIEPPEARRTAALTLLDVVGDNVAGADRIAAALPALERPAFRADWLGKLAEHDPEGAFQEMLRYGSSTLRSMAAEQIAAAWAAQDPQAALAQGILLPEDMAREFRSHVLGEWARLDPDTLLSYLETATLDPLEVVEAISVLALDPESLLAVADRRTDTLGLTLEVTALTTLAESDPQAALGRVEAMPSGPERDQAIMTVAMSYAMTDPDEAVSWIERMLPASPNARMLVALTLAEQDPLKALELLDSGSATTQENQMLLGIIVQAAAMDPDRTQSVAEDLAARDDAQSRTYLANLMSGWVARDAEGALGWALEHESVLDPALLGNAAESFARRDPAAAAGYLAGLPPRFRDIWITRVAGPYGRNDLDGAVNWVGQFRGQPVFDEAYAQLVTQAAQTNPERAGELLRQESAALQRNAAGSVARIWAGDDPDAAARWAASLNDVDAREQGLTGAVRFVARQESLEAARVLLEERVSDSEMRERIAEQVGLGQAQ